MKNQKMAGKGGPPSHKNPPSSSSNRKTRWESSSSGNPQSHQTNKPPDSKPSKGQTTPKDEPAGPSSHPTQSPVPVPHPPPGGSPFPLQDHAAAAAAAIPPPTPPSYGFHMLERRTIVLADGSVRSYFALPPDQPMDPSSAAAGDKFFQYAPPGVGRGLSRPEAGLGLGLGFDKHFPPPPPGGSRFSPPEDFRERESYGHRGGGLQHDYWASLGLDGPRGGPLEGNPSSLKRKYGEDDEFARHRQHVMQYGNANHNPNNGYPSAASGDRPDYLGGRFGSPMGRDHLVDDLRLSKHAKLRGGDVYDDMPPQRGRVDDVVENPSVVDVNPQALNRAFLRFSKAINENESQRLNYFEDGKHGPLTCLACGRNSKEFADVHGLIVHTYSSQNVDLRVDHLGLHKALCVLMGWNYDKVPENSKAYQSLSADKAAANREDLILWPPTVIIHNTNSGRRKDGRMEGMGNKEMDIKLKELGFGGGKSKSLYGKEGHMGVTVVKFASNQDGLKEADRLAEYFENDNHGRKGWARAQASSHFGGGDTNIDEKNPALVKVDEKTGEKKRIFYGYLATASDIDKVDVDMRKKAVIKSRSDSSSSSD